MGTPIKLFPPIPQYVSVADTFLNPRPMLKYQLNYIMRAVSFLSFFTSRLTNSGRVNSQISQILRPLTQRELTLNDKFEVKAKPHIYEILKTASNIRLQDISDLYGLTTGRHLDLIHNVLNRLNFYGDTVSADLIFDFFFQHELYNTPKNENLPDIVFGDCFNGVRRALRHLQTPRDIVAWYKNVADLSDFLPDIVDVPTSILVPFLSKLKTFLHNNADFIPRFRFYMDLGNLAGYPKMQNREMSDDPVKWLSTPTESQYDKDWWAAAFLRTFREAFKYDSRPLLSYREFVLNRWMWSTDGASKYGKAELDGEVVRTKFSAALSISDEELLRHAFLMKEEELEIGVFLKPDEAGFKRRLIANVSLGPYILASYIRYMIEHFVSESPLFMKLKVTPNDAVDVISLIKNRYVMLPLDESAYDYHVSRESWLGFIQFLGFVFPNEQACLLFAKFFDLAFWKFEADTGKWTSGMPSGLAMTSFLNSWMNYIKQQSIVPGYLAYAAGDDVCTAPFEPLPLEQISEEYAKFGSSINATKNWYSSKYTEFLKTIYHSEGTTGYPARIFSSLIWAGKDRAFLPSDKLPELAELFKQFYDRLGKPMDEKVVCSDLSRSVSQKVGGFTRQVASTWLHSPKAYGGFGMLPYNETVFEWESEILRRKKWTNVLIRVPEINFYATKVNLKTYKRTLSLGKTVYSGPPLRLPLVRSLSEWEARINGEDITVRGPFARMALDVIPLPTVNGISTSNMSAFATKYQLNVFPQLRGTQSTIQDRLVCASLRLVDLVKQFMLEHNIKEMAN